MEIDVTVFYPFRTGVVEAIFYHNADGAKLSSWKVYTGKFRCTGQDCKAKFGPGDTVLPVWWAGKVGNFVCSKCRGLLLPQKFNIEDALRNLQSENGKH